MPTSRFIVRVMNTIEEHYERLLGLESPWRVTRVKLSVEKMRVDLFMEVTDIVPDPSGKN